MWGALSDERTGLGSRLSTLLGYQSLVKVKIMLRPTFNRPVCFGVKPHLGLHYQTFVGLLVWDAISDERVGLSFTIAAGPRQRNNSRVRLPDSWPYFTLSDSTLPNLEARSPYLYPPGTGWPSYTPGNGFAFRRLLRLSGLRWRYSNPPPRGNLGIFSWFSFYSLRKDCTENTTSNNSVIVACVFVAAFMWWPLSHCLVTDDFTKLFPSKDCLCWFHNSGFQQTCHTIIRSLN
jgi:hypothetical protein